MKKLSLDRCTIGNMINCIADELKKIRINLSPEVIKSILSDGIEIENNKKKIKINIKNIATQPEEYDMNILNAIADKYFQDPHYKDLQNVYETRLRIKNIIRSEIKKVLK